MSSMKVQIENTEVSGMIERTCVHNHKSRSQVKYIFKLKEKIKRLIIYKILYSLLGI